MHRNPLAIGLIVMFAHSRPGGLDRCAGIGEIVGIDPVNGGYLVQDIDAVHPVDLDDGDTIREAEPPEQVAYLLHKAESIQDRSLGRGAFERMLRDKYGGATAKGGPFHLVDAEAPPETAADAATVGDIRRDTARIHANLVEGQLKREAAAAAEPKPDPAVPDVYVTLDELAPFVRGLHAPPELLQLPLGRYRLVKVD